MAILIVIIHEYGTYRRRTEYSCTLALHSSPSMAAARPEGFHLTNHTAYPEALPSRRIGP